MTMTDKLQPTTRAAVERLRNEIATNKALGPHGGSVDELLRDIELVCDDLERCNTLLRRLYDAAEIYSALQDGATDKRIGLVQPITVAEGNELLEALTEAAKHLEGD